MTDLTEFLPGTVEAIDAFYEANLEPRTRLGLSECGNKCTRRLWYKHIGDPGKQPEGRVLRLFQLGNILEEQVIADLKAAGVNHHSDQKEVVFELDDTVLTGHIDGIVEGLLEAPKTPHLFECKTASLKKFTELQKKGSYRDWNEVYFWQVQFYMLGLNLSKAAVFVYCKDDSRLYMERIPLNKEATVKKLQEVFRAITAPTPPERLCPNASWFEAKWCPYYTRCFND